MSGGYFLDHLLMNPVFRPDSPRGPDKRQCPQNRPKPAYPSTPRSAKYQNGLTQRCYPEARIRLYPAFVWRQCSGHSWPQHIGAIGQDVRERPTQGAQTMARGLLGLSCARNLGAGARPVIPLADINLPENFSHALCHSDLETPKSSFRIGLKAQS
jgi:hypothetical protein